jgi:hypothetical protein
VEQNHTRELYNGFGDTLARAFELVVTPALFGLIGFGIDRWLGTRFVFTVALTIFCLVGMSVRMLYGYIEAMKAHEAEAAWNRGGKVPPGPSGTSA